MLLRAYLIGERIQVGYAVTQIALKKLGDCKSFPRGCRPLAALVVDRGMNLLFLFFPLRGTDQISESITRWRVKLIKGIARLRVACRP